jgi:hypothetical protein
MQIGPAYADFTQELDVLQAIEESSQEMMELQEPSGSIGEM